MTVSGVESVKLKLARVPIHLDEINRIVGDLAARKNTHEIVKDAHGKDILQFLVDAPRDIQVIAGEIVYQLRSALDHLAFALVESNPQGIILPKGWERDCQFPICLTVPTHGNPPVSYSVPVPYGFFNRRLPGISQPAYVFIESLQPYHGGPGPHNILRIVGRLANVDKHRHLYVLLPRLSVRDEMTHSDGIKGTSVQGGFQHGAEIPLLDDLPGDPPTSVKRSFTPYITFNEEVGVGPDTLQADDLLKACLEQFESVIIPAFEKLIT